MTDFAQAFNEGLSTAQVAELAKQEIQEVLEELGQQILAASSGKVVIEVVKLPDDLNPLVQIAASLGPGVPHHWAITARNPAVAGSRKELARWVEDPRGYPCRVSGPWGETYCEDREALERCLADVLKQPVAAQKIYALMRLPADGSTSPPDPSSLAERG